MESVNPTPTNIQSGIINTENPLDQLDGLDESGFEFETETKQETKKVDTGKKQTQTQNKQSTTKSTPKKGQTIEVEIDEEGSEPEAKKTSKNQNNKTQNKGKQNQEEEFEEEEDFEEPTFDTPKKQTTVKRDTRAETLNIDPDVESLVGKFYDKFGFEKGGDDYYQTMQSIKTDADLVDYVEKVVRSNVDHAVNSAFASPELKKLNDLVKKGLDVNRAIQEVYGSSLELSALSDAEAYAYRRRYEEPDLSDEDIQDEIETWEEKGKFEKKVELARKWLKEMDQNHRNEIQQQRQAQKEAEIRAFEDEIDSIEGWGEKGNIPVPPQLKQALKNYVLKPVNDNGDTQFQLDMNYDVQAVTNVALLAAFDYNIEKLVSYFNRHNNSDVSQRIFKKMNAENRGKGEEHTSEQLETEQPKGLSWLKTIKTGT